MWYLGLIENEIIELGTDGVFRANLKNTFYPVGGGMAFKYIGNETNDPEWRMIGGSMMIVMQKAWSFF